MHLVSPKCERFQRKSEYLFNCRCPLCGDSQKSKSKTRGYFYRLKDAMLYKCHNCLVAVSMGTFLKKLDAALYKEYVFEQYTQTHDPRPIPKKIAMEASAFRFDKLRIAPIDHAERCDYLPSGHPCRRYLEDRRIPSSQWSRLFYTDDYRKVIATLAPQEVEKVQSDARLLIPYYDEYNSLCAISGRALDTTSKTLRYVTIRIVTSTQKLVYGREQVNLSAPVLITEGPLDSLFLPNAVASGDANLLDAAKALAAETMYLIYDNEPRNRELHSVMRKSIEQGYTVMIWPDTIRGKDINEMILNGHSVEELVTLITRHAAAGLRAHTQFAFWKKV